jgi:D-threo-aldose 1-dehydrogenase
MIDPTAMVRLGRTKLQVCRLGFGSAPLGGLLRETPQHDARAAVDAAFEAGLRSFDTAPQYGGGLAERRLGAALQERPRDAFTLSTKIGKLVLENASAPASAFVGAPPHEIVYDYGYDGVRRSLDASLARLGTDRVDILFIHDVNRKYHGDRVFERLDEAVSGACRALTALRDQGVIGAFGPATKDLDIACAFLARADIDCLMLPARYTLLDQSALDALIPAAVERGVSVITAAPFDSGILATGAVPGATYDYQPAGDDILARTRAIEAVCRDYAVPLAAAALQFPLRHPAVTSVVVGMRAPAEVSADLALARHPIPDAFWEAMTSKGLMRG